MRGTRAPQGEFGWVAALLLLGHAALLARGTFGVMELLMLDAWLVPVLANYRYMGHRDDQEECSDTAEANDGSALEK